MFQVFISVLSCLLSVPLAILLHELGHMIGGIISGYRLVYFEIIGFFAVGKRYRLSFSKTGISKKAGQCIMTTDNSGKRPYLLIMGGCLANIITGLIFLLFAFSGDINKLCMFFPVSAVSISLGMSNIFCSSPYSDGRTLRECIMNVKDMIAYNNIMRISEQIICNKKLSDIPIELFLTYSGSTGSALSAEMELYMYRRIKSETTGDALSEELLRKLGNMKKYDRTTGIYECIEKEEKLIRNGFAG